jgi:hypothetical protein
MWNTRHLADRRLANGPPISPGETELTSSVLDARHHQGPASTDSTHARTAGRAVTAPAIAFAGLLRHCPHGRKCSRVYRATLLAPYRAAGRTALTLHVMQSVIGIWILWASWGPLIRFNFGRYPGNGSSGLGPAGDPRQPVAPEVRQWSPSKCCGDASSN